MKKEMASLDISHLPELLRIAEEVRSTNIPQVLIANGEPVAMVLPLEAKTWSEQDWAEMEEALDKIRRESKLDYAS